jgi:tRNA (mo5U34)-methyltransferase
VDQAWLRKRQTWHVGPAGITVSMTPELAERLRESAVYKRVLRPLRHRRAPTVGAAPSTPTAIPVLDAEGQALLERIATVEWYHSIDLGHGVTTPGLVDHRAQLPFYGLPGSMVGMRVLDVGTYDGFWAFEFERRGAEVVGLDVANWADVDMPLPMRAHTASFGLDRDTGAAFSLAHDILDSKVRRVTAPIYEVNPDLVGMFDLVFVSDILLHLRAPQRALESLSSVCAGEMIVADVFTPMLEGFGEIPLAQYTAPSHTWWLPNVTALKAWMNVAGIEHVTEESRFILDWQVDDPMHKVVLRGRMNTTPWWLDADHDWIMSTAPDGKLVAEQPA